MSEDHTRSILEEAAAITAGARPATYGHPLDDYQCTADLWTALLRKAGLFSNDAFLLPEHAALMMAAVKLSRLAGNITHHDSLVDGAGYLRVIELIQTERNVRLGKGVRNEFPDL